jgi:hypothetical protein
MLNQAPGWVISLVIIGMLVGTGLYAITSFQNSSAIDPNGYHNASSGAAWLAVNNASSGIASFSTQLPTIGVILGIVILVGVVLMAFGGQKRGR